MPAVYAALCMCTLSFNLDNLLSCNTDLRMTSNPGYTSGYGTEDNKIMWLPDPDSPAISSQPSFSPGLSWTHV